MELKWYAVYTMPQHEKKVAARLSRLGIEHYLPLQKKKRKWSDRIKIIEFPLFSCYIFVRIDYADRYLDVLKIMGVKSFVRYEYQPAVFRSEDLENLKLLVSVATDLQTRPDRNFPEGQPVKVIFGPFKGVEGVVARVKNKTRLFVRLKMLGRMVSAEIDALDLERRFVQ